MNKVKNILVLQSRIEILVTVPALGHGAPVCGFHTRPLAGPDKSKTNPLAHWASKNFFHLPSSNSYLPRICVAQIPICPTEFSLGF